MLGAYLTAREAARRMSESGGGVGGSIVLISSAASRLGSPNTYVDYAGSKGAIDTLASASPRNSVPRASGSTRSARASWKPRSTRERRSRPGARAGPLFAARPAGNARRDGGGRGMAHQRRRVLRHRGDSRRRGRAIDVSRDTAMRPCSDRSAPFAHAETTKPSRSPAPPGRSVIASPRAPGSFPAGGQQAAIRKPRGNGGGPRIAASRRFRDRDALFSAVDDVRIDPAQIARRIPLGVLGGLAAGRRDPPRAIPGRAAVPERSRIEAPPCPRDPRKRSSCSAEKRRDEDRQRDHLRQAERRRPQRLAASDVGRHVSDSQ